MVNGRLNNIYDDVDMRSQYNRGYWHGAFLTTIILSVIVLVSIYTIGYFF